MELYKRILMYMKPYYKKLFFALGFSLTFAASNTLFIPLMRDVSTALGNGNFTHFNIYVFDIVILYSIRLITTYGQTYLMSFIGSRIMIDMRNEIYTHLHGMSLDFFTRWKLGDLIARVFGDIGTVQGIVLNNFTQVIPQSLTLIGVFGYLLHLDWVLTLLTMLIVPLIIYLINYFAEKLRNLNKRILRKGTDITSIFSETMAGIRIVKAFSMENHEIQRFVKENEKNFKYSMRSVRISALQEPILGFLQFMALASVIWFGGYRIIHHTLTIPELVSFFTGLTLMIDPIITLSKVYTGTQSSMVSAQRVFKILDTLPSVKQPSHPIMAPIFKGKIDFDHVNFQYNDTEGLVLKDICLNVEPGEMIALVGPSGVGKTTFVNLIPRFYDLTTGTIHIDGIDIREYDIFSFRQQIGIVPQEPFLFSGSIENNILYGTPDAHHDLVVQAAKQANCHDFIMKLRAKYHTKIGERGVRLSGGQKQRIAIARAILKNPRILILDEATSSLDTESERLVQDALDILMKGRTSFVIAHRLSTVINADRIIVFNDGKIVEVGKHQELLNKNGHYKHLFDMQFRKQTTTT